MHGVSGAAQPEYGQYTDKTEEASVRGKRISTQCVGRGGCKQGPGAALVR